MEDLHQSQIRDSCRLAMPEGLRDLMSDISREVLRAQPPDLCNFIVRYLEAMLMVRNNLCVACRLCRDVCQCACHPELEGELRNLGLDGEDLVTVKNLVMEYFDKVDDVKEENLLMTLLKNTEIDPNLLPDIQNAVRVAFQKHLRAQETEYWVEAINSNETGPMAAKHTLQFHDRAQEDKELSWDDAATTIQSAYRGFVIRGSEDEGSRIKLLEKCEIESTSSVNLPPDKAAKIESKKASTSKPSKNKKVRVSLSSASLAGSLINLPKYVPYSVHDITYSEHDVLETERSTIDYTHESHSKDSKKENGTKKIAFSEEHVLPDIDSCLIEEENVESCLIEEENVEEEIEEEIKSEAISFDEIRDDKSEDDVDEELESALD